MRSLDLFYQVQMVVGLISACVIAGAWWYAALRLSYHWILFALAIVASVTAMLSLAFFALMLSPSTNSLIGMVSHFHIVVNIAEAVLYVIFAGWLVRQCQNANPPGSAP